MPHLSVRHLKDTLNDFFLFINGVQNLLMRVFRRDRPKEPSNRSQIAVEGRTRVHDIPLRIGVIVLHLWHSIFKYLIMKEDIVIDMKQ